MNMAEVDEQTKRDALFVFDALKHVTTKVVVRPLPNLNRTKKPPTLTKLHQVNAGEIAQQKDVKINTIETRFSAIKKRHNLNISTTTTGFTKQKPNTPKKVKAIKSTLENGAQPKTRTPNSSAKKRQADVESWHDDDGESTPTKRYRAEMEMDKREDVASWQAVAGQQYDDIYGTGWGEGV
jgi:hypothetical protein